MEAAALDDATQPGATQPGATQPGATQPGATQPGATQPNATQPGERRAEPACDPSERGWLSDTQRLVASVRDAMSIPRSRVALLLQLSLMAPPLPRRHHRRIASAILEDAARQNQGEAFELPSGDMVLLCQMPDQAGDLHPDALPAAFARLLAADLAPGKVLTRLWHLERDGAALLDYVAGLA